MELPSEILCYFQHQAIVLTGELGYTEQEVACIDPDMADLAIERAIRRPASGMPDDWVGVGAALVSPPSSSSPQSSPSPTLDGEDGGNLGVADAPAIPGALNLDEILDYSTADAEDTDDIDAGDGSNEERLGRRGDTRRDRLSASLRSDRGGGRRDVERRSGYGDIDDNNDDYDDGDFSPPPRQQQQPRQQQWQGQPQGQQQQQQRRERSDSAYFEDERSYDDRRGGDGRAAATERENPRYYYQDDDRRSFDADRQQQQRPRRRGEQGAGRGRREDRARPARELDPAEKYERSIWGSEEDEDEEGKIWTGVGPDGPWPT